MSQRSLRIQRPRVLWARRRERLRLSPGDEAQVELLPGLAELLALRDSAGRVLGEGLAHEWWLGLGAAATAALQAAREDRGWLGVSASVDWRRAALPTEVLRARAAVERVAETGFGRSGATVAYEVVAPASGEVVAHGKIVLAASAAAPAAAGAATGDSGIVSTPAAASGPAPAKPLGLRARELAADLLPPLLYRGLRRLYRSWLWRQPTPARLSPAPPKLRFVEAPHVLTLGTAAPFTVEVANDGTLPPGLEASLELPFGYGLSAEWVGPRPRPLDLRPGESTRLTGRVQALRPHEVNLGRPWPLACVLKGAGREWGRIEMPVEVPDEEPGRILYVLTEDCETFDGGETTGRYGRLSVMGNANGYMDPEEYRFQMIEKPQALNRIAEAHGARFTHFWATTQLWAAEWACTQSTTGAWPEIVRQMEESVRSGSARHEYAPHIHFDFEPASRLPPQPRLCYDPGTDGLLPVDYYDPVTNPDHKYHGWDGARRGIAYVKRLGDLADTDSKAGSLRKALRHMVRLSAGRQPLVTRTGACDFGSTAEDLATSFRALAANGLLADADAGVYDYSPHPRGRQIYFCQRTNLEAEIERLEDASLVQLRGPGPQLDHTPLGELNAWFDRRVAESAGAGVRAIVAMTHAMFMRGEPDPFRDASGGDFDKLDRHLDHVRRAHPGVRFATASEATIEFLDYYTPLPLAVVAAPAGGPGDDRTLCYPIRILGRGIPLSPSQPLTVSVVAPLVFDTDELESLRVLERGVPVAELRPGGVALACLEFAARGREGYVLEVRTRRPWAEAVAITGRAGPDSSRGDTGAGEGAALDLLHLAAPRLTHQFTAHPSPPTVGDRWDWVFPAELFRLLVGPIAGRGDPLARRLHPYGWAPLGMAIHACRQAFPGFEPRHAEVRWLRPLAAAVDFRLRLRLERVAASELTLSAELSETMLPSTQIRLTLGSLANTR